MSIKMNSPTESLKKALSVLPPNVVLERNANGRWIAKRNAIPLANLGPFGIAQANLELYFSSKSEAGIYTVNISKWPVVEDWILPTGNHSPISNITLLKKAKQYANIPSNASHFCWCYPPVGISALSSEEKGYVDDLVKSGDVEFTFLAFGGFAYFSEIENGELGLIQVNTLVSGDQGLKFEGPFPWKGEYTESLFRESRFQDVTIQSLTDSGVKLFCFVTPFETFKSSSNETEWTPCCPNGGFVFLYNENGASHPLDCYFSCSNRSSFSLSLTRQPFNCLPQ